jgi:general nucleoside transport system permease protein
MDEATITLFLASAFRLTGPILVAALGEVVSERAGVFNVSLEGMMLLGAFGAVVGVNEFGGNVILGVLSGIAAGALSGAVVGLLVVVFRADQIVTGIGFNFFALGLTAFLVEEFLAESSRPVAAGVLGPQPIPGLESLPLLGESLFTQTPLFYLTIVIAIGLWFFLRSTRQGLQVRAAGEGAAAADAAGVSVVRVRMLAVLFTGLMAGLAGAYLAIVQAGGVFVENMTGGRGYLAIAIAIFGRWNPPLVCGAALLFGAADALQYQGQSLGLEIPSALLLMFPFVLAVVAWALLGRSKSAPVDLGRPFVRAGG